MSARRPPVRQYLLTIQIAADAHLHAYLLTDDKRYVLDAGEPLVAEAEKQLGFSHPLLRMILATPLEADVELVREILRERSAEAAHLLATAVDYHLTIFATHADDPDDAKLLALH